MQKLFTFPILFALILLKCTYSLNYTTDIAKVETLLTSTILSRIINTITLDGDSLVALGRLQLYRDFGITEEWLERCQNYQKEEIPKMINFIRKYPELELLYFGKVCQTYIDESLRTFVEDEARKNGLFGNLIKDPTTKQEIEQFLVEIVTVESWDPLGNWRVEKFWLERANWSMILKEFRFQMAATPLHRYLNFLALEKAATASLELTTELIALYLRNNIDNSNAVAMAIRFILELAENNQNLDMEEAIDILLEATGEFSETSNLKYIIEEISRSLEGEEPLNSMRWRIILQSDRSPEMVKLFIQLHEILAPIKIQDELSVALNTMLSDADAFDMLSTVELLETKDLCELLIPETISLVTNLQLVNDVFPNARRCLDANQYLEYFRKKSVLLKKSLKAPIILTPIFVAAMDPRRIPSFYNGEPGQIEWLETTLENWIDATMGVLIIDEGGNIDLNRNSIPEAPAAKLLISIRGTISLLLIMQIHFQYGRALNEDWVKQISSADDPDPITLNLQQFKYLTDNLIIYIDE